MPWHYPTVPTLAPSRHRYLITPVSNSLTRSAEARALGRGGLVAVHRATGIAKSTIRRGLSDLELGAAESLAGQGRARRVGGGRKSCAEVQPKLAKALDRLIDLIKEHGKWVEPS